MKTDIQTIESFNEIVGDWRKKILSNTYMKLYIIGLGRRAIPLILQEFKNNPRELLWADILISIVGEIGSKKNNSEMVSYEDIQKKWIEWGERTGYMNDASYMEEIEKEIDEGIRQGNEEGLDIEQIQMMINDMPDYLESFKHGLDNGSYDSLLESINDHEKTMDDIKLMFEKINFPYGKMNADQSVVSRIIEIFDSVPRIKKPDTISLYNVRQSKTDIRMHIEWIECGVDFFVSYNNAVISSNPKVSVLIRIKNIKTQSVVYEIDSFCFMNEDKKDIDIIKLTLARYASDIVL